MSLQRNTVPPHRAACERSSRRVIYWLRTLALAPLLLVQGIFARKRALILPEPPGPRSGETGHGPALRLLVTGDSAAAGVGAAHQDEALLGQLIAGLSSNYRLCWQLEAKSGATTLSTIRRLQRIAASDFDVVTTSLGVNDITSGVGLNRWLQQQAELRDLLRQRFAVGHLVLAGLPPVHLFPGLPQPLRWHLGLRAKEFDRALGRSLADEHDTSFVQLDVGADASHMASDGFHPGPYIYARWAEKVVTAALQSPHAAA